MNTKHGVLTPQGVMYKHGDCYLYHEFDSLFYAIANPLQQLMYLGISGKFTHLWVHPSCQLRFTRDDYEVASLLDPTKWDVGPDGKYISVQKKQPWLGYISSITGRCLQPKPTANTRVIFLEQTRWPLASVEPVQLLTTINTIENKLEVAMSGAPATVGLRYLKKMNTRYYDHYFEKSPDVDWDSLKDCHVPSLGWFPPVAVAGEQQMYVHCFDRNSSQPYAASQEDFGIGDPVVQMGGEFNKLYPGLWDVEVYYSPAINNLPPILPKVRAWLPTPLLRVASLAGYMFKVNRGLVWKQKAPIFERWAKNLWSFREQYQPGAPEREAFKIVMNATVGGMRMGGEMEAQMRPDWYDTIIGSERAVVWYKALKMGKDHGVYPCGIYCDALYYLSSHRNPEHAVPGILKNKNSLGGYKHVWTLPVDASAKDVLARVPGGDIRHFSASQRIGELKKLVEAHNG